MYYSSVSVSTSHQPLPKFGVQAHCLRGGGSGAGLKGDARVWGRAAGAEAVPERKVVDDVEALDKVRFFDEFFTFLKQRKVWPWLEALDPQKRVRASIGWAAMVGVYIMRIVLGVPSVPPTQGGDPSDPAPTTL